MEHWQRLERRENIVGTVYVLVVVGLTAFVGLSAHAAGETILASCGYALLVGFVVAMLMGPVLEM